MVREIHSLHGQAITWRKQFFGARQIHVPNEHSVYIHDTPARSLFSRDDRALSHGCIRIQNPADFAAVLLKDDISWTAEKIDQAMHQKQEKVVNLDRKIPVVLLYLTFWADSKGQGHFRQDIYERDEEVLEALRK